MKWFRRTPLGDVRWAVIDCETSGLDPARDRLLSVGAVMVRDATVDLQQVFQAKVRQTAPSSRENILIHGIGADAQLDGRPLEEVVCAFDGFVGASLPVAFHAAFDAAVLRRHGVRLQAKWLDLAALLPALFPRRKAKALDEWLAEFGIAPHARHDALGDAFTTAQLMLVALHEGRRQGLRHAEDLPALVRGARFLV